MLASMAEREQLRSFTTAKVRRNKHNTKQNAKFFLFWLINMQLSFDLYKNMGIFISCTQNFI